MAREEEWWCYFDGVNGSRRPMSIPLLLVVLCALLAGSLAVAEHDHSYYSYARWNGKSSFDHQSSNIRLIDGENLGRVIRATPNKSVVATEQKEESSKDQPLAQPPPQQQQQSQQQQHQEQQQSQQQSQPQQSQSQQPQQQASPTQPATSNITNASAVTYSTAYSTSKATSTVRPPDSISISKPDFKKKASQAANPPTDTVTLHIWANQTLSNRNVTDVGKEQQLEQSTMKDAVEDVTKSDDISTSKFSDVTNTTLTQKNITKTIYDHHQYYNSTFIVDVDICKKYWVDMDNHPDLKVNYLLSQSHLRAAIVKLKFDFPFYGYNMRNITIATGGFLYTGDNVHAWLAATQYIAPLMADFDFRLSNASYVKYADNGESSESRTDGIFVPSEGRSFLYFPSNESQLLPIRAHYGRIT